MVRFKTAEVTPEAARANCWPEYCPAVHEVLVIEEADGRPPGVAPCPSLFEVAASAEHPGFASGCVAVIGKRASQELIDQLEHKIGPDEVLILVPKNILVDIAWTEGEEHGS